MASWLDSFQNNVKDEVVKALQQPLQDAVREETNQSAIDGDGTSSPVPHVSAEDEELQREFIMSLGDHFDEKPILRMLEDHQLLPKLAKRIYLEAKRLKNKHEEVGGGDDAQDFASKFFEDGDGKQMGYGDLDTFHGGLDGFLGPPNPNLQGTI